MAQEFLHGQRPRGQQQGSRGVPQPVRGHLPADLPGGSCGQARATHSWMFRGIIRRPRQVNTKAWAASSTDAVSTSAPVAASRRVRAVALLKKTCSQLPSATSAVRT